MVVSRGTLLHNLCRNYSVQLHTYIPIDLQQQQVL